MKTGLLIYLILLLAGMQGCSKESIKRSTFGGAQLYGQQQCNREVSADCPEPDSYEEYQRKREELKDSQ